ncbi:hypothetical protein [Paenibacillus sp. sgz500992]|uniref:hypothetical protein n=1 Tax=Paenibacillus sp. sgz500992 TaxID=3242476 RepID=UPI0036D3408C
MITLKGRLILMTAAITSMLLLQACGQNGAADGGGESFAAAVEADSPVTEDVAQSPEATQVPIVPKESPAASPTMERSPEAATATAGPSPEPELAAAPSIAPSTSKPLPKPSAPAAVIQDTSKKTVGSSKSNSKSPASPAPETKSKAKTGEADKSGGKSSAASPSPQASSLPEASPAPTAAAQLKTSSTGHTAIDWNGFFDGSDQTRPSEQFWDLSGSEVTIKGFMGEVLSFEKNWFLLIPEPGAECPFDNGDETYWNKIMIVFVPEGSKLRHTSGPLQITGRLDVGIKIDESGYKTMFRLYDASFKSI